MAWKVLAKWPDSAGGRTTAPVNCEDQRDVVGMYRAFSADGEFERVWIEDMGGKEISPRTFGIEEAS